MKNTSYSHQKLSFSLAFLILLFFASVQGCSEGVLPTTETKKESPRSSEKFSDQKYDAGSPDSSHQKEVLVDGIVQDEVPPERSNACNGSLLLCQRHYNEVVYATTHNSMSNQKDNWAAPNQKSPIATQLQDGIRGLMLDTYEYKGEGYLCHGTCVLGKKKLVDGLSDIRNFLDSHKREIITIIFETYLSPAKTKKAFMDSKLLQYAFAQKRGEKWPTLQEMIESGKRLVVFTSRDGGSFPWYHKIWDFAWETHWSNKSKNKMTCKKNRGKQSNALFIFNHFLSDPLAKQSLAKEVNFNPFFIERAKQCQKASGKLPNFVTVDFYEVGDIFEVVRTLNGL